MVRFFDYVLIFHVSINFAHPAQTTFLLSLPELASGYNNIVVLPMIIDWTREFSAPVNIFSVVSKVPKDWRETCWSPGGPPDTVTDLSETLEQRHCNRISPQGGPHWHFGRRKQAGMALFLNGLLLIGASV